MGLERKVAWAALTGTPALALLVWGLAQTDFHWPPLVVYGAITLGAIGLLIAGALWCHIGWKWVRAKGLQLGPAIVIAVGLAIVVGGTVWGLLTWPQAQKNVAVAESHPPAATITKAPISKPSGTGVPRKRTPKKAVSVAVIPAPAPAPASAWPTGREYVDLSPQDFVDLFKGKSSEEERRLLALYAGSWMKVDGTIDDFSGPDSLGGVSLRVSLTKKTPLFSMSNTIMLEFDKELAKQVLAIKKGTRIRAIGQFRENYAGLLFLNHSEIVSQESPK